MESGIDGRYLACRQADQRRQDGSSEQPSVGLFDLQLSRTYQHLVFVGFHWPIAILALRPWSSFRQFYAKGHSSRRWSIWGGRLEGRSTPLKRKPHLFAALRGITGSCGSWLQRSPGPAICSSLLWLAFYLCSSCLSDFPVGYSMLFSIPFICHEHPPRTWHGILTNLTITVIGQIPCTCSTGVLIMMMPSSNGPFQPVMIRPRRRGRQV